MSMKELKQQRTITKKNISRIKTLIEASAKNKYLSVVDLKQILSTQTKIEGLEHDDNGCGTLKICIAIIVLTYNVNLLMKAITQHCPNPHFLYLYQQINSLILNNLTLMGNRVSTNISLVLLNKSSVVNMGSPLSKTQPFSKLPPKAQRRTS